MLADLFYGLFVWHQGFRYFQGVSLLSSTWRIQQTTGVRTRKIGLINSAWEQAGRPTDYRIIKTRELGFDTIDIFTDPLEIPEILLKCP